MLPDPELEFLKTPCLISLVVILLLNGRPTKANIVWRSLVNVNHVKAAISTLRSCNWLYRDIPEECIDETTKHIIEVTNNASTKMLEKVSPEEVDAFQSYTIRNLDNNLSTSSDIEQYIIQTVECYISTVLLCPA